MHSTPSSNNRIRLPAIRDLFPEFLPGPASRSRSHPRRSLPPLQTSFPPDPHTKSKARRHVCPECHKRFNRPSSLNIHLHTHTGERPYMCPHPGCFRTFNVSSNMRRHFKSHEPSSCSDRLSSSSPSSSSSSSGSPSPEPISTSPAKHWK